MNKERKKSKKKKKKKEQEKHFSPCFYHTCTYLTDNCPKLPAGKGVDGGDERYVEQDDAEVAEGQRDDVNVGRRPQLLVPHEDVDQGPVAQAPHNEDDEEHDGDGDGLGADEAHAVEQVLVVVVGGVVAAAVSGRGERGRRDEVGRQERRRQVEQVIVNAFQQSRG